MVNACFFHADGQLHTGLLLPSYNTLTICQTCECDGMRVSVQVKSLSQIHQFKVTFIISEILLHVLSNPSNQFIPLKYHPAKYSKCSDNSHSSAKLQKLCWLSLLNTQQSHKAYCAWSFPSVCSNCAPLNCSGQHGMNCHPQGKVITTKSLKDLPQTVYAKRQMLKFLSSQKTCHLSPLNMWKKWKIVVYS